MMDAVTSVRYTKRDSMMMEDGFCSLCASYQAGPPRKTEDMMDVQKLDENENQLQKDGSHFDKESGLEKTDGNESVLQLSGQNISFMDNCSTFGFGFGIGKTFEISIKSEGTRKMELEPEDFVDPDFPAADIIFGGTDINATEVDSSQRLEDLHVEHESSNLTVSEEAEMNRRVDEAIAAMNNTPHVMEIEICEGMQYETMKDLIPSSSCKIARSGMIENEGPQMQYVDSCVGQSQSMVSVAVGDSQPWELMEKCVGTSQPILEDATTMTSQNLIVPVNVLNPGPIRMSIYSKFDELSMPLFQRSSSVTVSTDKGISKRRKVLGELTANDIHVSNTLDDCRESSENDEKPESMHRSSNLKTVGANSRLRVGLSRRSRVPPLHFNSFADP